MDKMTLTFKLFMVQFQMFNMAYSTYMTDISFAADFMPKTL